jgi:hypothetical protein
MKKYREGDMVWEYWIEAMMAGGDVTEFQERLNKLGIQGWEAVSSWFDPVKTKFDSSFVFVLFKRLKSK